MSPKQSDRPTTGELGIMFDNLCDKVENLGMSLTDKIDAVDSRMTDLQTLVVDLREYKSQVNGSIRTVLWLGSGIVIALVSVSWFALNLMLGNMEQRIRAEHIASVTSIKGEIIDYIDNQYVVENVITKK